MTHQGNAAVHQHPPAVEYSRTRRSLSAATGRLSVSAILTIARSYRQPPLPRRTKKRPGDHPGRCGCRSAAHAKQNVPHRPDRAAIKIMDTEHGKPPPVNSSREDWTDDIRSVTILQPQEFSFSLSNGTLPLISGFVPGYPSKSAIDREKTLVLRTKVVFW